MLGPEKLPYGSLGAYANALSVQHNLSSQQMLPFLINDIPTGDLPVIAPKTYSQTAALAGKPESPDYWGALDSIAWADEIENRYGLVVGLMGKVGAVAGGSVEIAAQSVYQYNLYRQTYGEQVVPTAEDLSFSAITFELSAVTAPILAAGVIGAYIGKKWSPTVLKSMARAKIKRIKRSGADPDTDAPDSKGKIKYIAPPPAPSGSYLETVEEGQLYPVAERWANLRDCHDETKYADFLIAGMSASEITALIQRTTQRLADEVNDRSNLSRQDPRYAGLLQDMQMAKAITNRTTETHNMLRKVYRGVGYLGALGVLGAASSSLATEAPIAISYPRILLDLSAIAITNGLLGSLLSYLFADKTAYFTRQRSRLVAARAKKD